ncbi:putative Pyridoxal phosphate phosphatase PHOSPHO2 [Paratrimastix pyriformis]|uniref:Pyridoxal phosphate phosphatase PHOSPHO2 n=1 Tax=Paratrimastix pyriformis TaxID=342808 RepID=A0ABQ8U519_9EUKA|nr:putative Pyridoxal phosphate phosphatase PHOSPHO2 [Paratrimastix pyriformis]
MTNNRQQILCVWDFDNSLIDENSDTWIVEKLAPDLRGFMSEFHRAHPGQWTALMQQVFFKLHERGITRADYERSINDIPVSSANLEAIRLLHRAGADVRILSDANTFFIEAFLKHHGLSPLISHVASNPAHFDLTGQLRIDPYTLACPLPCPCQLCPANLCKGQVLSDWLHPVSQCQFDRVFYVGDGAGDLCPALRLSRPVGYVLARAGCSLERLLSKRLALDGLVPHLPQMAATNADPPAKIGAAGPWVGVWRSGEDVFQFFSSQLNG